MTNTGEGILLPFFFFQDVVMGLMLKFPRLELWLKVSAQKRHPVKLIRIQAQSHPHQVQMVWHQAVGWAKQTFAGGDVKHQFAKFDME